MSRWVKFFLVIAVGLAAGMFYGWVVNPVEYIDIAPEIRSAWTIRPITCS